jgi:hypothetical protein
MQAEPKLAGNEISETLERILSLGQAEDQKEKCTQLRFIQRTMESLPSFIRPYVSGIRYDTVCNHAFVDVDIRGLFPTQEDGKLKHGKLLIKATKHFPCGEGEKPAEWEYFRRAHSVNTWCKAGSAEHAIFMVWQDDLERRQEFADRGQPYPPASEEA